MITIYAQYSFGGYKILRLSDSDIEEVTVQNRLGLPPSAVKLFSHYGIKLICTTDVDGNHLLYINDIPCLEKDDMGRAKTCSMLICSNDEAAIPLLRRIASEIILDISQFENFFSRLFAVKETLTFDFVRFKKFIDSICADKAVSNDRIGCAILSKDKPIILYTTSNVKTALEPLYDRFGKRVFRQGFLMKWDQNTRKIKDISIQRSGYISYVQKIINKIMSIWKN